jgi:hypothetical protein
MNGFPQLRPLPLRRPLIHRARLRVDDHAVELGRGFDRDIALAHVLADLLDRALPGVAVAAAAAGADAEGVAVLLQVEDEFRVVEILIPCAVLAVADRKRVTAAFLAARPSGSEASIPTALRFSSTPNIRRRGIFPGLGRLCA